MAANRCILGEPKNTVPIGQPIAEAELLILDDDLQLVPLGVKGELYIGGNCVGRGYINRPELNAEKFVPHPFGQGISLPNG